MAFTININQTPTQALANLSAVRQGVSRTLEKLSTGLKINHPTDNPLDPNIGTTACYSQIAADMLPGTQAVIIYKQGDIIDLDGNTYKVFCEDITQEEANNPDLWMIVNIYDKDTNTNTCWKVNNSDLKKFSLIIKNYIAGEDLLPEEVVYYNITNSTTKTLNRIYKFDPINNTNVIDRHQILGINVLTCSTGKTSFVCLEGDLYFTDRTYDIKKYYIDSNSKLTSTPPTTGILMEMGMGVGESIYQEDSSILIKKGVPILL